MQKPTSKPVCLNGSRNPLFSLAFDWSPKEYKDPNFYRTSSILTKNRLADSSEYDAIRSLN